MTPLTLKTVTSESTTYTLDATRLLPPVLAGHLKMSVEVGFSIALEALSGRTSQRKVSQ